MNEDVRKELVRKRLGISSLPPEKKLKERNLVAGTNSGTKGFANLKRGLNKTMTNKKEHQL